MRWILENKLHILYGIVATIVLSLLVYLRYYSGIEGFQAAAAAPTPACSAGFVSDGKGFCIGYTCHGGPDKKKSDGTNTCLLKGGKTVGAVLTKHPMQCGKGYATVTSAAGVTTCVKV